MQACEGHQVGSVFVLTGHRRRSPAAALLTRDHGAHGAGGRNVTAIVLLVIGYLVALAVLARLKPVLAERRLWWFVALEGATASIVAGWLLHGRPAAALFNGAALVGFAVAWVITGRRARQKPRGPTRRV